jgi:hypothetical protein
VSTPRGLSGRRKQLLTFALGLAIWGTLGLVVLFSGALASALKTATERAVTGYALGFFLIIPALVGAALGVACFERRAVNPPIVWVAAIWNGIVLGVWIVLSIVGTLAR